MIFTSRGRTHRSSHPRSSNYCVRRSVFTHSLFARTFFCNTDTARTLRTFSCVLHTCMAQGCLQCACRHLSVISPSPFSFLSRPCSCFSLTVTSRDHSRLRLRRFHWRSRPRLPAELSRPKSAGQAHSARGRGVWQPGQVRLQHTL